MALEAARKFLGVPSWERGLLVRAIVTLGVARVMLKLVPFARVRRFLTPRPGAPRHPNIAPHNVRWAIKHAERVIPDATCLPQAVTAEALLARAGHPVLLRIGVMKRPDGRFEAHAWAESRGRIVIGDLPWGLGEYSHLPPLPGAWDPPSGGTG